VLNEPNLEDQANMVPAAAAAQWHKYEEISAETGVKIVGPQMNYGTLHGYTDPEVWMDEFIAEYKALHGGRAPQIDALGIHWYDYGLESMMLGPLSKYGKPFWVTEMANWHAADDWTIDTVQKQRAAMVDMVAICESRADVFRYAWFTGRWADDTHHTSLLDAAPGSLTAVGDGYLSRPYTDPSPSTPPLPRAPPPSLPPLPSAPPLPPFGIVECATSAESGWECLCCAQQPCAASFPSVCQVQRRCWPSGKVPLEASCDAWND
jgi:hypothetical protein